MGYTLNHYVHGKAIPHDHATHFHPITNPALGEEIGRVPFATLDTLNLAIQSAEEAFPKWAATPPLKRARVLFKFKELLETHQEELARLVTKEHGKTLEDARGSIARGIELTEFMCGIPHLLQGTFSEQVATHIDCYTLRQPLGICAGVSPFNFPVMVPLWMMLPAIACGNCFILKPSEQDPSAPLRLVELLTEAGLPPGVANLLHGDKTIVEHLLHHPKIQTMTAVASTPVAEHIYKTAINEGKRAHTFGGAKNHCLVMPDCDINEAASALSTAAFGSAGERCMAISVAVVVGEDPAEKLAHAIASTMTAIKIGPGDKAGIDMGPLVSRTLLERVRNYIDIGVTEGATLRVDGRQMTFPEYPQGYFLGPSLFDNVTPTMRIYKEEIFGPVLIIVRVPDFETGLDLINANPYGNGTAIFTHDGDLARTFASQVQVGMVGINIPIPVPVAYHPFGGWKRSVFGDIPMHGNQSIQFYTKVKSVTTRWPKSAFTGHGYTMPHMR